METEFIYSKITKVSKTSKGARINITDQYLNNFVGRTVLVRVGMIKNVKNK